MTTALVLAGGRATRMGGGDKGLKTVGGVPIMTRVLQAHCPQVVRTVINADGNTEQLRQDYELPVITDGFPDHLGPLAGILAGMDYAAEMTTAGLLLVAERPDSPFLPVDLARLEIAMNRHQARVAVAHSGGYAQPTIALWDISLRHDLRRTLTIEGFARWYSSRPGVNVAEAEWPVAPYDPFK